MNASRTNKELSNRAKNAGKNLRRNPTCRLDASIPEPDDNQEVHGIQGINPEFVHLRSWVSLGQGVADPLGFGTLKASSKNEAIGGGHRIDLGRGHFARRGLDKKICG